MALGNTSYFEKATGFLALNKLQIVNLTDVSLSYSVSTDELATMDTQTQFQKMYEPTWISWECSGSFICTDAVTGSTAYTGSTQAGTITGSTNGILLLEAVKNRAKLPVSLRLFASNIQRGTSIITKVDIKSQSGKEITGTISLQGSGQLVKSTT